MRHKKIVSFKHSLVLISKLFHCTKTDLTGMGDGSHNSVQLSDLKYREKTFNRMHLQSPFDPHDLAMNGFYYTSIADQIKCHGCDLVTMSSCCSNMSELNELHMTRQPACQYVNQASQSSNTSIQASGGNECSSHCSPNTQQQCLSSPCEVPQQNSPSNSQLPAPVITQPGTSRQESSSSPVQPCASSRNSSRTSLDLPGPSTSHDGIITPRKQCAIKGFHTFDSLRFERERLMTYIDWPVPWLNPASLAREGLYYLRDKDHVSCVFCRGIIGSWEPGDIPKHEHKRHFPYCAFVKGQAVGNVPLALGDLLYNLVPVQPAQSAGNKSLICKQDLLKKEHNPKDATKFNPFPGLPMHSPPKRSEYITLESRLKTYVNWPHKVKQDPRKLAEAGFFHCGLSDHVRCYHCGQGLRNWEETDDPWVEHARWYPDCDFVLVTKGIEFIDTVRRENPPYIASQIQNKNKAHQSCPSSSSSGDCSSGSPRKKVLIEDSQLDRLMDLDIMQAAINMGFPIRAIKAALKRKIETTGVPFFELEICVQQILNILPMIEQEEEVNSRQSSKMSRYNQEMAADERRVLAVDDRVNALEVTSALSESSDESSIGTASDSNIEQADLNSSSVDIVEFPIRVRNSAHSFSSQTSGTSSLGSDSSDDEHTPPTILENREDFRENSSIDSHLDATLSSNSSNEMESNVSFNDNFAHGESVDIIEFPLVRGYSHPAYSTQTSGTSSIGSDSIGEQQTESNEHDVDPTTTSTPRASPMLQMYTYLPPFNQASSSSSSGFGTLPSSGNSSSSSETLDTIQPVVNDSSREIMSQVDEVLSRAEIEKKKVMRYLSNGSSPHKSSCTEDGDDGSRDESSAEPEPASGESVTAMEDEESVPYKEMLVESKKKVTELEKEVERLKDMRTCRVCMDNEMSLVFLPCLHMATCATCGVAMSACPICRADIVHIIRPNIVA